MDVMVQCEKDGMYKGEVFYIPIVIGDAKEHLFPNGLYQTGIPFNEDRGKDTDSAGNTVEFRGYDIQENLCEDNITRSCVNVTNNYRILGIIVYDGVFNY